MATHLEVREDGTIDIGWHDVNRVLSILAYTQIPNHSDGILTYISKGRYSPKRLTVYKYDRYNVDYFHELLDFIGITPVLFITLAFEIARQKE